MIGNSIVIHILTRKKFRKFSIFRYCFVSTVFNTIQLFLIWFFYLPDFLNKYSFECKVIQYFTNIIAQYISTIKIIISIDRYLNLIFNHRFCCRKNYKCQSILLCVLFLICMAISFPYFSYYDSRFDSSSNTFVCEMTRTLNSYISLIIDSSEFFVSAFIPFLISLIINCKIYQYLAKNKTSLNRKTYKKETNLFKIIVSTDIFFAISYFPWFAYVITSDVCSFYHNFSQDLLSIFYDIAGFMYYLYPSCTFFVYYLSSKMFKKYFHLMIA